ncbi:MAG: hypothetical protein ACQEVA_12135, partial [Myxococcota bacterium]
YRSLALARGIGLLRKPRGIARWRSLAVSACCANLAVSLADARSRYRLAAQASRYRSLTLARSIGLLRKPRYVDTPSKLLFHASVPPCERTE